MSVHLEKDPLLLTNPKDRPIPVVFLIDISDGPIDEMYQTSCKFANAFSEETLALERADISVISFDSFIQTEVGFRPASEYEAPVLSANGLTSLNKAILAGLDAIESRKQYYSKNRIDYYRPWLFVLTDGAPTDTHLESEAKNRLQDAIRNKKDHFEEAFVWLGNSIRVFSNSDPPVASEVKLPEFTVTTVAI